MPSSSDWSGHAGCVPPDGFRGSALVPWEAAVAGRPPYRRTAMERRPYLTAATERGPPCAVATGRAPPVVSGRWRVLGAASRRAIASRKAVPADVKEPFCSPIIFRNAKDYIPFPRRFQAGFRKLKFCARFKMWMRDGGHAAWKAASPVSVPPGRRLSQLGRLGEALLCPGPVAELGVELLSA